jgi:hypothetical protein
LSFSDLSSLWSVESGFTELGNWLPAETRGPPLPTGGDGPSFAPSLRSIECGELLLKFSQLGQIVVNDIGVVGMEREEILVIRLGGIESLERDNLGHNRLSENPGVV